MDDEMQRSLQEMRVDIPWKNLRSSPVVVNLTGLRALTTAFVCDARGQS